MFSNKYLFTYNFELADQKPPQGEAISKKVKSNMNFMLINRGDKPD